MRTRRSSRARQLVPVILAASLAAPLSVSPAVATPTGPGDRPVEPQASTADGVAGTGQDLDERGVAPERRDALLGDSWDDNGDEAHVVVNDANGVTVLSASSSDGYAWAASAALPVPDADTDAWVANSCITSSGDYMAVVYAPRTATNDEDAFAGGADAAIVNLRSGAVSSLGTGYTLSYFNPGCGADDTVTITRFENKFVTTRVAVVDATSATVVRTADVAGQATSAVSLADGTLVTALGGDLVSIPADSEEPQVLTTAPGAASDLAVDDNDRLAYVSLDAGLQTATAFVTTLDDGSEPRAIGTGPVTELGVAAAQKGGFYLTGAGIEADLAGVAGVAPLPDADPGSVISSTGAVVVSEVNPVGLEEIPQTAGPDATSVVTETDLQISATVVETDTTVTFTLDDESLTEPPGASVDTEAADAETATRAAGESPSADLVTVAGDAHNPVEAERYCAVPRNDPHNQAYQPKPRQVEWAVNRAVKGELTQVRPANWRNLGMASYSPQAMFPKRDLIGGGNIPPQIVLGVLAQESNLWQASRFTAPGNTGNPLMGDYYGTRATGSIWEIDYEEADCGYGIGQITDGMRVPGHPRVNDDGLPIESALPEDKQRAIALDYTANIAKAVQMLGDKWNELARAGLLVNDGDPDYIENWFLTTWAYNSGFNPDKGDGTPWGVGWFNNPISTRYNPARAPFLQTQADAAHPQDWPYPEKVTGWAAYGTSLVETQYADPATRTYKSQMVSSFRTAWWNGDDYRASAKPPIGQFCDLDVNDCDPYASEPCQLSSSTDHYFECWWHEPVVWKDAENCDLQCGHGFERFPSSYATEASSMASTLPALTLQSSYLPNCQNPPAGTVVVDDTTHPPARNAGDCAQKSTAGSFQYTFGTPDAAGQYPAKVDLHQQGGGFNGHFSFAHMQSRRDTRTHVTGTWNRGADMSGTWTRVWVHLPDYAGWTQQAGYTVDVGDGTTQTRYLPQRRYKNEWVSLGVFEMKGSPKVSLSNVLVDLDTSERLTPADADGPEDIIDIAGYDDVAWDAVGFQALPGKPNDFVVALGDSYASGEGAGNYAPWSDNNGSVVEANNACHQSANAWIRKTTLPGDSASLGSKADAATSDMDFHFLACSGAQTEDLLPFYSVPPSEAKPQNADEQNGAYPQAGLVSQIDAGYLDTNTTLVTLSIGGNDMRFSDIIKTCVIEFVKGAAAGLDADCSDSVLDDDEQNVVDESNARLADDLPESLTTVLRQIRHRAPNAQIAVHGYPKLFESGSACIMVGGENRPWLNAFADSMNATIAATAQAANEPGEPDIFFVDTQSRFSGHNLCTDPSAMNGLHFGVTPGENPLAPHLGFINGQFVSRISVHPNDYGTTLYSEALEAALAQHP